MLRVAKKQVSLLYPPPRNKALLRAYEPLVSLNKALLNPYFWGGYVKGGGRLTGHDVVPSFSFQGSHRQEYGQGSANDGAHQHRVVVGISHLQVFF